jgi:hypothetical protein
MRLTFNSSDKELLFYQQSLSSASKLPPYQLIFPDGTYSLGVPTDILIERSPIIQPSSDSSSAVSEEKEATLIICSANPTIQIKGWIIGLLFICVLLGFSSNPVYPGFLGIPSLIGIIAASYKKGNLVYLSKIFQLLIVLYLGIYKYFIQMGCSLIALFLLSQIEKSLNTLHILL